MRILNKANGFRTRSRAECKLHAVCKDIDPIGATGFIISNADGTFTPAIMLADERQDAFELANRGIQVFG